MSDLRIMNESELVSNLRRARELLPGEPEPVYSFTDFLAEVMSGDGTTNARGWDFKLTRIIDDCNGTTFSGIGGHKYPKDELRGDEGALALLDKIPEITNAVCPAWFAKDHKALYAEQ